MVQARVAHCLQIASQLGTYLRPRHKSQGRSRPCRPRQPTLPSKSAKLERDFPLRAGGGRALLITAIYMAGRRHPLPHHCARSTSGARRAQPAGATPNEAASPEGATQDHGRSSSEDWSINCTRRDRLLTAGSVPCPQSSSKVTCLSAAQPGAAGSSAPQQSQKRAA